MYGHINVRTYERTGIWTYGHMNVRTYKRTDIWTYGHMKVKSDRTLPLLRHVVIFLFEIYWMSIFLSLLINLSIIHNLNSNPTTCSEISDCAFTFTFLHGQRIFKLKFSRGRKKQVWDIVTMWVSFLSSVPGFKPLNVELNPICHLLALLGVHFLHVSRIRVKPLTLRLLMSYIYIYIYGAPILDVSRSHTTTHHSR